MKFNWKKLTSDAQTLVLCLVLSVILPFATIPYLLKDVSAFNVIVLIINFVAIPVIIAALYFEIRNSASDNAEDIQDEIVEEKIETENNESVEMENNEPIPLDESKEN